MKIANFLVPSSPSPRTRDPDAGPRKTRSGMRMWFAAALALATLPAFAQTFPATLSNTASISPPANVTNVDTACTSNGGVFNAGVCSATDNNTLAAVADLTLTKTNGVASVDAGSTTTYTIVLTNNGPSAANGTVVRDPAATGLTKTSVTCTPTGTAVCPAVSVAAFESGVTVTGLPSGSGLTFTVVATVTATSGSVTNAVTATLPPNTTDPTPTGTVTDTDTVNALADLAITKSVAPPSPAIGSNVTFTITVNNNVGPSDAAGVLVNDALPAGYTFVSSTATQGAYNSGTGVWTVGALARNANATLTIVATVKETGPYTNTATVSAATSDPNTANNTATATPTPVASPSWTLDKATTSAPTRAGDTVTYTFSVTNTGNVTINNVSVADPKLPSLSCTIASVAPGATASCTPSGNVYTVTQANVDAGSVVNTATASGTPTSGTLPNASDTNTVTIAASRSMTIDKTSTATTYASVGQVLPYSYAVTNTGNVTITAPISVTDDKTTVTCPALPAGGLAPGQTLTCTANYTVTQADLNAGKVTNIASATDGTTTSPTDTVTINATQTRSMSIDKTSTATTYASVGQVLPYSYAVTNTGNVTITAPISVTDDKTTVTCPALPAGGLAPGQTLTCTANYTVTQADLNAGKVTNIASATDGTTTSPTDTVTINATQTRSMSIDKTSTATTYASVGQVLPYSYVVTNTGNVTITAPVSVTDDKTTVSCPALPAGGLAPGQTLTCTANYTVTQADLDAGKVTNIATATDGTTTSPPDSVTINATRSPALSIDKTSTATTYTSVGQVLPYSYVVTNTGNVTITAAISVTDDKTTVSCPALPAGGLAPGQTLTCTANYTVTQADLNAGKVTNIATATDGTTTSPPDSVTVNATQTRAMTIDKTSTATTYAAVGDVLPYSYVVTNTGNVTITAPISVTDDKTTVSCPALPAGGLAPGQTLTCTANYTVTQADLNAGKVTNIASATDGTTTSPTDTVTINATQNRAISIDKTSTATTYAAVGDVLPYSYAVTNTGNVTITAPISVTDDKTTVTCPALPAGGLAPGQTLTCSASYTVTQADLNAGKVTNIASATDGTTTSPTDTVTINATQTRSMTIDKTSTATTYASVGQVLPYSYAVTNTGNVTITAPISVADDKTTVSCPALPAGGLAPGQTLTCTANYTVTQADLNAGKVTNIASATDGTTTSPTDTVTINATQNRALSIDKNTTSTGYAAVGDTLNYTYLVTNTGNVTITAPVSVTDDKTTVTCPALPAGGLAPSQTLTCSASYTVTQADLDAGKVTNIASATDGTTTSPTDTVTVNATQNPGLSIDKTSTATTYASVGQVLPYSYVVTNTGNVTLTTAITVADDKTTVTCPALPAGGLAPSQTLTCTASYTVTQADLDAGAITNIASARSGAVQSLTDSVTINANQTRSMTIDKTSTATTYAAVGDVLPYSYVVTNTGNVTITAPVSVSDDKTAVTCPALPAGGLTPGQTLTCTANYTVTQADLDAGKVTNIATATDGTTTSPPDSVTVTATQTRSMTIDKTSTATTYAAVGDVLPYSYAVTNTGNVTITAAISVTDDKTTVTCPALPAGGLAPGQTLTCTANYTVTQADLNAGKVTNIASATDGTTTSPTDTVTINATQTRSMTIDKTSTATTYASVGQVLPYSYVVTNTGNVTITAPVSVTDDKTTVSCPALPAGGLAPGQTLTCTANYTVTQADLDAGKVTNIATATDGTTTSPPDSVTINATRNPAMSIDKTSTATTYASVGQVLPYSYVVTNTGNVTITAAISVTDDKTTVSCPALPAGGLAPGQTLTCTANYTVTQADLDAGKVTNIATATDGTTTSPPDSVTINATRNPAMSIDKTSTATTYTSVGQVLPYSYVVTNTGNVTITTAITVADDKTTVSCPALPAGGLAPGQTLTCTANYTVTQADLNAGKVTNIATATDGTTTSPPDTVTVNATQTRSMSIDKTSTATTYASVGQVLPYSYAVTNTGNVTITTAITVADDKTTVSCPALPAGGLAPGQTLTCTANYTVTQADLDAGKVTNIASATDGTTTSPTDTVTINATRSPAMSIDKTSTATTYTSVGQVLPYSYVVTNTGNVTITAPVSVTDDKTTVSCPALPAGGLAPGQILTCTANYTVTQADLDAGKVTNIATATDGTTTSPPDTVTVNATQTRAMTIDKTSTATTYAAVGDVLPYSYVVTNTGNVTITAPISVTDDKTTVSCPALPAGGLAPGQTLTCTANYTVIQADLDAGKVTNIASATDGTTTSPTDTVTINATRNPAMTLTKAQTSYADNDASGTITIGDVLTYTLTATNTGNVTLNNVVITDSKTTPSSWNCPPMAPTGASAVCTVTGTYTVTQADATAGSIVNNASVTSTEITTPVPATSTTQVQRRPIVATNDAGTVTNGAAGGVAVPNVLVNDTLNGQPATTSTVTISQVSTSDPKVTVDPATGAVHVAPGTPKGSYTVEYKICEIADPTNCTTASVAVTVDAAPIDAVDDIVATPVNGATGGTNVINVLGNDTLGGSAVNPADVSVKPNSNGPLTVKADGNVDVAPGTPAGTYTVTYQLCEVLNPSNCDTATVTITVSAPAITATDDPAGGTGTTPQNTPVSTNVIANDTLNGAPIDPNLVTITVTTAPANGTTVVNSDGTITYTPRPNFSGDDVYTYTICEKLNPTNCATAKVNVTVQPNKVTANPDTAQTNQQTPVTINVIGNDTVTSAPLDPASVTVVGQPANGTVTCSAGSCTYTPKQFFAGTDSFTYRVCDTSSPTPVCANATVTIKVIANAPVLRLVKTSAVREVKIGDLVRYSVSVENVGDSPAVNATLVDIPPAGFTFVDNSLTVDDDNKNGVVISANPLRIGGIDVAIGGKATVSYFLRVGAGVGKGVHKNQVAGYDDQGTKISNDATAEVTMAGDPLLEDSLLVGSVFDDRDGDGWQDPAKATGVRVQGGFAPSAYVAGSTTVDRGEGPVAEPDASAPMLHGIALGRIDGRGSAAAPTREVVVRQTLSELAFTDDFVLTTDEGTTVRMGADGRSTVERTRGDAAKGLTGQDLQVVRNVSQGASGYVVSYTIRNNGIEERGIPGVRIASVEGLIMETDAYGRYHLEGIDGGNAARGRNFILKVDPATLPPGSVFTTENPRVRRITQGIPTRFDFGVKLPPGEVSGAKSETDVELGEVMFEAGSAQVKESYAPMFGQIATRLRDAGGGSVTVTAQAEEEALAFARARAVQAALLKQIEGDPALASKVKVDVVAGTDATLVSLDPAIRLGEVLFDTDQATIKPQYRALISEIAKTLNQQGSGAIGVVGRADKRGAAAYNVQLGLRRAKAVFEAISAELKPEVRQKVRVDITDDTQAPVGVGNR
ncbi:DUF11 domain-containing protein [Lysobacter sp. K5869]|uniref:DUF7507 domain-containing protein n=1 Tax=Lysobacter sp. K5869 TaxID=2820808 RepID=UPI001C06338B|nr:Ig-like domain-containing protein [Lysobacter sp. K5869]QWP78940.1 DUF11 domain-containing protein [Lysobacter sp. K5869]